MACLQRWVVCIIGRENAAEDDYETRGVRSMNRTRLRSLILVIIVLVLAASIPSYGETAPAGVLPAGVLPTPVPSESIVSISLDRDTYAPGDRIEISISVDTKQAGFLYVYDIDPTGAITLLYPNRYQPDPSVSPGTIHLPGEGYHLVIGGPEGLETVVAILARAPIDQLSPSSKTPFRNLDMKPQALVTDLSTTLASDTWTSAWAQFTVYQPKGIVHIGSRPAGARILINGHDRGFAPKDLILPAGEAEITLSKNGYEQFSETVVIHDQDTIEIDARLQEVILYPGSYGISLPVYVGIDVGTDSIGMEVGIARAFGIATALRFTGDAEPMPGEMYDLGPELDLDLRLHLAVTERVSLLLGGGIGLQNRTLAPAVVEGISTQAITIEPDVETEVFPSLVFGLEVDLGHAGILAGYHLRRGFLLGIRIGF